MLGFVGKLKRAARLKRMTQHLFATPAPAADARIHYGGGEFQFGDLRLPKAPEPEPKPYPVVIVIHGGFWRAKYGLDHIAHVCTALTAKGMATWSIEYSRLGNEGGGWPGTFHDVGAAVDHLREIAAEYKLDLERVVVIGHSAGGHLALWTAGRHRIPEGDPLFSTSPLPVRAVVSLAGVADLDLSWEMNLSNGVTEELLGGAPDEVPERYAVASPRELLPLGVPQALIHGTKDENVPYEISQKYRAAALAAGDKVELVTLKGTGHFEIIDPQMSEWRKVAETVMRHMSET